MIEMVPTVAPMNAYNGITSDCETACSTKYGTERYRGIELKVNM
jgi:hypothetical protein